MFKFNQTYSHQRFISRPSVAIHSVKQILEWSQSGLQQQLTILVVTFSFNTLKGGGLES